ncbi:creatininase family protein [Microbacterium sp. SCN 71-17]|uniref:creatininase family protein n=1 Tax=Microbacterium sp. SCN 71-17 TaxID=1660111 RepID=UPI00345DF4D4
MSPSAIAFATRRCARWRLMPSSAAILTPAVPGMNHGEEIETSMVLAVAPDLVHPDRAQPQYPEFPVDFGTRPVRLHEIGENAVFGDPRPATAAKGETLFAAVIAAASVEVERFLAG